MKRILVRNHGPSKDNAVRAIAAAVKCAQGAGVKIIHLIVPAKVSFSGSIISQIVGDPATDALLKGKAVAIREGISMKLESSGTAAKCGKVEIVLAAYLDGKAIRQVETLGHVKGIVFLPWLSEEGVGWQESWHAEVLGEALPEDTLNLHAEVEAKLRSLTGSINLSTGLSHPSDLQAAKRMFSAFEESKIPYEPKDVRSWALRNGWRPDFAEDLYELARKSRGE